MSPASTKATSIQRPYYAETARDYDQMHMMDREHNIALERIHGCLRQNKLSSILDVGCGTGRGVKYLLDREIDVTGVEPVGELLREGCRQHGLPPERMNDRRKR